MLETNFDPSAVGVRGNLFGLPWSATESDLVILPVPWEVTVSYGTGTMGAPAAVLEASAQVDLELVAVQTPWQLRVAMLDIPSAVQEKSISLRQNASQIIDFLESEGGDLPDDLKKLQEATDDGCEEQHEQTYQTARDLINQGKIAGMIGGDHSTPYGLIRAVSEQHDVGILQIDAHMDLRKAYEGFKHSHASIMYNALQLPGVKSITQVGIRDFCLEELEFIRTSEKPVNVFYDEHVRGRQFAGEPFQHVVKEIVSTLPDQVYISFDIDGLNPSLCPNTGTPVPGGLSFNEAVYLMEEVVRSGRKIVGFDLSEVAPGRDHWDANVGSRVLFRLCMLTGVSQGLLDFK